jgi:DNA helicase II / ATP-dependent DNA helicase PcrA
LKNNQFERDFENKRLEQTISIAQDQLSAVRLSSEENKAGILSLKKEMREDTTHSISNLWSSDNFDDLVALNQYANPISDKISEFEMEANKILSLERTINSPYFARIDFRFDDEDTFENIYIGMSSLMDDHSYEMYIYDWRSPIASVFYRFGTGKVFYEAPAGKITGEINLKRQYEINKGKLEYFFDADIQIQDEFLRKLLSQNASSKMKTIVETIQKDQDIIIRDMEAELMMVQGVAGSGKTSVALHRVAYLMYQGLSGKLSSNNIVIISPNTLFEQYISNVLPELGEKNVNSVIFEEILETILQNQHIQTKNQLLESLLSSNSKNQDTIIKSSIEFKGSSQFVEILKRFVYDLPNRWIEFNDVYYNGKYIANRQLLKAKMLTKNKAPRLGLRLKQLEHSILENIHVQRKNRLNKLKDFVMKNTAHSYEVEEAARMLSINESTALIKEIRKFTELNCLDLYRRVFSNKEYFYSLAKNIELPNNIEEIIDFTRENLDRDYLQYDDALALAFLHLNVQDYNNNDYENIKQVVIDEAQDYYPMHFEILNLLFSKSRYTVLGDINQTIGKQEDLSLYDQFSRILCKKKSTLITMDKSFRCTSEISEYSTKFLDNGFKVNSFSRKGDATAVYTAKDISTLDDKIISEIISCREKNYESIGLICKTEKDASSLYERLKGRVDIQLIKSDGKSNLRGIFIMPVYLSKGLEFDAVLICDTDHDHYNTEDDKKLLYIACTRALHRLNLFYTGVISPLL